MVKLRWKRMFCLKPVWCCYLNKYTIVLVEDTFFLCEKAKIHHQSKDLGNVYLHYFDLWQGDKTCTTKNT